MPTWGGWKADQSKPRDGDTEAGDQSYRTLIELSPDALIVHDGQSVLLANPAMARLVGAQHHNGVVGCALADFVAPSSQALVEERIQHMHQTSPVPLADETWRRFDGSEVEVEVAAAPMPWISARAAMVIARDVTERRRLEAERETLLAEKELLMREVHHRVGNSLQLVQGMLNLQARGSGDEAVRFQLHEAAARIGTIGTLHSRLQKGSSTVECEVKAYIEGVMSDLRISLGETYKRQIVLDAGDAYGIFLKADLLVALGLIAAEGVTNSIKHGEGHIRVRVMRGGANLEMTIEDDGPGLPIGFDPLRDGQGLGMRMIASLAQSRGGKIEVGAGSRITAFLPLSGTRKDAMPNG
ncbi:sensor histidine kinase [Microvirga alba]|uniref:histidine kinase n=1 Tax=Microvirga alba TaxID=2791025 RepID=A0A931FQS2_9HYPH|nr:histidine kinase dimerization/phosphoacceptor domain -containing protein [Microvirga alba]MBF9234952.1 PAS domain S-box protein [Microvirga alba]